MGSIYKRGSVFWVKYYRHGKPYRESSKSDKITVAERILKKREGEIADGKLPGIYFDRITFNELAEDFLTDYRINGKDTLSKAERSVRYLKKFFGYMKATEITTDKVKTYIDKRMEQGMSNASINRELAALKRMFHLGAQCTPPRVNLIPYIPMLKESNVRKGFFEYNEYITLLDALPSYLKPLVTFGYLTGWRVSEIRNLSWDKVDPTQRTITLDPDETKNEESRTVYMDEELIELMRILHSQRRLGCPYVFHRDGKQIKDFRAAWKNACIKAGLWEPKKNKDGNVIIIKNKKGQEKIIKMPTKIFHDLRRTGVREMIRSGISETVAMRISGHKTRSVFDRYNITSDKDLKEAAKKREEHLQEQKKGFVPVDTERGEIKQFKQA